MPRRKQKSRKSKPRDPEKLCRWVTDGKRCGAYRQKGRDYCSCHPPGQSSDLGKKGAAVTNSRWQEIEDAVARLPLLTPQNQARYLNALIAGEDQGGRDLHLIAKLQAQLHKLTADNDEETHFVIEFVDPKPPMDDVEEFPAPPWVAATCPKCGHHDEPEAEPDGPDPSPEA